MRRIPEDLAHRLAAEYALGTLQGRARARFEAIARSDPAVEAIRQRWMMDFAPLARHLPEVEPPRRVWEGIEQRIGAVPPARGTWSSLPFWRGFGLVAGGLASVLLATFLYLSAAPRTEPSFVAVLVSPAPANEARMVVTMQSPDTLLIHNARPWKSVSDAGRALELWAIPREGPPQSLGLVDNAPGESTLRVRLDPARAQTIDAIALSSEPAGGSPTRRPTGPVLCSGMLGRVRRT